MLNIFLFFILRKLNIFCVVFASKNQTKDYYSPCGNRVKSNDKLSYVRMVSQISEQYTNKFNQLMEFDNRVNPTYDGISELKHICFVCLCVCDCQTYKHTTKNKKNKKNKKTKKSIKCLHFHT